MRSATGTHTHTTARRNPSLPPANRRLRPRSLFTRGVLVRHGCCKRPENSRGEPSHRRGSQTEQDLLVVVLHPPHTHRLFPKTWGMERETFHQQASPGMGGGGGGRERTIRPGDGMGLSVRCGSCQLLHPQDKRATGMYIARCGIDCVPLVCVSPDDRFLDRLRRRRDGANFLQTVSDPRH